MAYLFTKHIAYVAALILIGTAPALPADCRKAIDTVLAHEGGYQNSRADGGNWSSGKVGVGRRCGGTKYGIACAYNPDVKVQSLTRDDAIRIYERKECQQIRMSELSGETIPTVLLDLAVNMGAEASITLMKRTMNLLNGTVQTSFEPILLDSDIAWFNEYTADPTRRTLFYSVLVLTAIDRYAAIVEYNKKQAVWLLGWIRRAIPNEIEQLRALESSIRKATKPE